MIEANLKGCLKAIVLELRRQLEGYHDAQGNWQAGDLERRLAAIGVRRDRPPVPVDELPHLAPEDRDARRVVDAFLEARAEAGVDRAAAIAEFVARCAYTWANRLLALRCMEARGLIDEVILQKEVYGERSLQHNRLARKAPECCAGEDEGLFTVLFDEFAQRAKELPLVFNPKASEVALRPSVAVLKRFIGLLSGTEVVKSQEAATDEVFTAPDTLGWAYQYWNTEEKERVFDKVRTKKGSKIEGAEEIIPATCIYTEPYIVKFLVQNSLGALWMGMYPKSPLCEKWAYFVRDADRAPIHRKSVREITLLDPTTGSGHFLLEAFSLFYDMYQEEGQITDPAEICAAILERNLYGIDIDERAIQIAALALAMKAKEKAPSFVLRRVNLVATNIRLPSGKDHLEAFLMKHPEDADLRPALVAIFDGLSHADELGSLLQIEEPVDREFTSIRRKLAGQLTLTGPKTEEDWQTWKTGVIERLRQHFDAEAEASDLVAAFFGEAGAKGLSLFEMLSRRYDVVAANPPYMGSKNMCAVVKNHIELRFRLGKRDLYAAFIVRCLELTADHGRTALLTQQSWMFLDAFNELRGAVLDRHGLALLAHLGPRTFKELSNTNALGFCMFIVRAHARDYDGEAVFLRTVQHEDKLSGLLNALQAVRDGNWGHASGAYKSTVDLFLKIKGSPLFYWAPRAIREAFMKGELIGKHLQAKQGLITGDNERFLRCFWEASGERWRPYMKGGPYRRWYGNMWLAVDWSHDGAAIKNLKLPSGKQKSRPQNLRYYFRAGATWTAQSSYGLSVRFMPEGFIFDAKGPAFFAKDGNEGTLFIWLAVVNSVAIQFAFRGIQPTVDYGEGYLVSLPAPTLCDDAASALATIARTATRLKAYVCSCEPNERSFSPLCFNGDKFSGLRGWATTLACKREASEGLIHTCEGAVHRLVVEAYGLDTADISAITAEWGTPVGWFPLITGYDALPAIPSGLEISSELSSLLAGVQQRELGSDELIQLKRSVRELYEAGSGRRASVEEENENSDLEEDEADESTVSARIAIPTETFLEELSQKLEIHPISVYWLLCELREKESLLCPSDLRRLVEEYVSVLVLRLLGHRWPSQIECGEALPVWADADGIIPLTESIEEPTLFERVRERIAEDFGSGRVNAIEQEFEQITGKPLSAWLATEFFRRHASKFKKRPIAWQIESARSNVKRVRRGKRNAPPAFSCLVYYHRLDGDLLPKLRSQYVGPLRSRFQTELAGLERLDKRTADQDERRVYLDVLLEELKDFDGRLEQLITGGFSSAALDTIPANEPLDKWTSRNGVTPHPRTRDAFLAQERRYDPDLNDGVRVNIAPLQKAGLLAADVLSAKDVEKAIADRAEWRGDERRWCREGKLPHPGWWPAPKGKTLELPTLPDTIPTLEPLAEASVMIWAFVHASNGTIARLDLARAFSLRSQPSVLLQLAPGNLRIAAEKWVNSVGNRTVPAGLLATALSGLAERDGIRLTTDAASRSIVTKSEHTPSEDEIDPWFRFEARLALAVLAALEPKDVTQVDARIAGGDRTLLATGAA